MFVVIRGRNDKSVRVSHLFVARRGKNDKPVKATHGFVAHEVIGGTKRREQQKYGART
ncbi:MAG TPA: hypothetical protein VK078_09745 [Pseudogracilibacillus sp.]|nr:hypothetical protein [Pseudogracilibacillus sp.]